MFLPLATWYSVKKPRFLLLLILLFGGTLFFFLLLSIMPYARYYTTIGIYQGQGQVEVVVPSPLLEKMQKESKVRISEGVYSFSLQEETLQSDGTLQVTLLISSQNTLETNHIYTMSFWLEEKSLGEYFISFLKGENI